MFSNEGQAQRLVADIVFVGSVSKRSNTWLWSWANPSVDKGLSAPLRKVRDRSTPVRAMAARRLLLLEGKR